jgi:exodeoxyribonuclease III
MTIDIDQFLHVVAHCTADKKVPVVDLIAVQSKDPYKVLVATILSARTKDETTAQAASRLFEKAPTVQKLASLSAEAIEKLIYPVGFYKNKARYLASLPQALQPFNEVVPDTIDELLTLPGVGRKTANLVVATAFKKPAICVDTHVHRIMNIWKYVKTEKPEQTETVLRQTLPAKHWLSVNSLLVAFGQSICRPVGAKCDICPLDKDCPKKGVIPRKKTMKTKTSNGTERYISWNVNGIRALEKKGFTDIVQDLSPDILAIQETKAQPDQLSSELINLPGYYSYFHSAQKKGYSGVAVYSKKEPLKVVKGIGVDKFDCEGRVITLEYERFFLVNIYFPNSGAELKRLDFKLEFNSTLHTFLDNLTTKKAVVICGDYNVAHKEIDIKNPKANVKNAGFTPEERAWMDHFIDSGYVDTFRLFNQEGGNYTWWSYRFNARAKNIGWRIDYFCVDIQNRNRVASAEILSEVMGSDHCPVALNYRV